METETNRLISTAIPVGVEPHGVTITPDGRRAFVANDGSGTVSVLEIAST